MPSVSNPVVEVGPARTTGCSVLRVQMRLTRLRLHNLTRRHVPCLCKLWVWRSALPRPTYLRPRDLRTWGRGAVYGPTVLFSVPALASTNIALGLASASALASAANLASASAFTSASASASASADVFASASATGGNCS